MNLDQHKKSFGNSAEDYTKYRKPYTEELFTTFFAKLDKISAKILDIACGTGKSTESLLKEGMTVSGVDHDPLMIAEAKKQATLKNLSIAYAVSTTESLPFEQGAFDAVTVGTAFHWFATEKALTEIKRVLADKGLLFIYWTLTTKDVPEENSVPRDFFQKYNWPRVPPELRDLNHIKKLLEDNGFAFVETVSIPYIHEDTVEEYVGLMRTASVYDTLSSDQKEFFVKELTELLQQKLGDRKAFPFEEEIQICYGYKK